MMLVVRTRVIAALRRCPFHEFIEQRNRKGSVSVAWAVDHAVHDQGIPYRCELLQGLPCPLGDFTAAMRTGAEFGHGYVRLHDVDSPLCFLQLYPTFSTPYLLTYMIKIYSFVSNHAGSLVVQREIIS